MNMISIASVNHPERLKMLVKLLNSINSQTIVPELVCVSLEGYTSIPKELDPYKGVIFHLHPERVGGISSYEFFSFGAGHVCISLDDDIIIPETFVEDIAAKFDRPDLNTCFSYLSKHFFPVNDETSYNHFIGTHFSDGRLTDIVCHVLGSGIAAFRSEHIFGCYEFMEKSSVPGMYRDMMVSYFLWRRGINIIRPASVPMYLSGMECADNCNDKKSLEQRQEVFAKIRKRGFLFMSKFGVKEGD